MNEEVINEIEKDQKEEIERRKLVLRKNKPLPDIQNKIIILVDDGIAMGSTIRATIKMCIKKKPKKLL